MQLRTTIASKCWLCAHSKFGPSSLYILLEHQTFSTKCDIFLTVILIYNVKFVSLLVAKYISNEFRNIKILTEYEFKVSHRLILDSIPNTFAAMK